MGTFLKIMAFVYVVGVALFAVGMVTIIPQHTPLENPGVPAAAAASVVLAIPAAILYAFGQVTNTSRAALIELKQIKQLLARTQPPRF